MQEIALRQPYLVFVGDEKIPTYAKTGLGLAHWCADRCAGQLRLSDDGVDLGLPDMTVREAAGAGVGSLVIGTALVGGELPAAWLDVLVEAANAGLDIVAGTHASLSALPRLYEAAARAAVRLVDVRVPPTGLPVASGRKRSGLRLLTVGTDCAVGKKYTALALARDFSRAGLPVDFRASGQTGIMIAGRGIPIDAVVADFLTGAAELLSPDNEPAHWDVIEGQGAIFHPGYAAVSHGLLIGSQADAVVVCHEAGRTHIEGWEGFALPSIEQTITRNLDIGSLTNPGIRCVGISVNTSTMPVTERGDYLAALADRTGLPCVDPLADGTAAIVERISSEFETAPTF